MPYIRIAYNGAVDRVGDFVQRMTMCVQGVREEPAMGLEMAAVQSERVQLNTPDFYANEGVYNRPLLNTNPFLDGAVAGGGIFRLSQLPSRLSPRLRVWN